MCCGLGLAACTSPGALENTARETSQGTNSKRACALDQPRAAQGPCRAGQATRARSDAPARQKGDLTRRARRAERAEPSERVNERVYRGQSMVHLYAASGRGVSASGCRPPAAAACSCRERIPFPLDPPLSPQWALSHLTFHLQCFFNSTIVELLHAFLDASTVACSQCHTLRRGSRL